MCLSCRITFNRLIWFKLRLRIFFCVFVVLTLLYAFWSMNDQQFYLILLFLLLFIKKKLRSKQALNKKDDEKRKLNYSYRAFIDLYKAYLVFHWWIAIKHESKNNIFGMCQRPNSLNSSQKINAKNWSHTIV